MINSWVTLAYSQEKVNYPKVEVVISILKIPLIELLS